jgi:hypothetical protein
MILSRVTVSCARRAICFLEHPEKGLRRLLARQLEKAFKSPSNLQMIANDRSNSGNFEKFEVEITAPIAILTS